MDAEREIAKYKDEQEEIFEQDKDNIHKKIDALSEFDDQANEDIKFIISEYEDNKEAVIKYLLEAVKDVSLIVPKVIQGKFE